MQLTKSQNKVINELFHEYLNKKRNIVDFRAPTGSGKTFMTSHFVSKVFANNQNNPDLKTMVVIATVSNAELPKAFAKKMTEYKKYLPFNDFEIEFRESPSSAKTNKVEHVKGFELINNKVLIFGTSSFGKKKIFTEQGILENFILEAIDKNWNIIYIRDEAHKGGAKNSITAESFYKRFEEKMVDVANFTIQMTATPKGRHDLIELKDEDLLNDGVYLLKNNIIYNDFQRNTSTSDDLIRACLDKFKVVQKEYKKLLNFIRPALLIQVDSKNKNITQEEYDKTIQKIINIVDNEYKLNYLKYFSDDIKGNCKEDRTLESASNHDSSYDVIIFKVGPSTGWDIPRACMLLQIREVSSETLNIQTIGRIKRNPMKGLVFDEITDKYYIYSNYQEGQRKLASYKLKNKFYDLNLYQGNLDLDEESKKSVNNEFYNELLIFFKKEAIKDFCEENSLESSLPIEERNFNNKRATRNYYSLYLHSIFRLKLWNDQLIEQNKKYFTSGLISIIKKLSNDFAISEEIIKYTIFKRYLSDIKKIYSKCYQKNAKNEQYKLLSDKKLPKSYQMWIAKNEENKINISNENIYGYELIKNINDKKTKNILHLDSNPEHHFMNQIFDEMDEEDYCSNAKFFAKMPTFNSEIYFEYFNTKEGEKRKSFVDFALIKDKQILMFEIKGWNDYDEQKTNDLLKAYAKYKEQNPNKNIELLICYSGKKDGKLQKPEVKYLSQNSIKGKSIRKTLRTFFNNE